MVLLSANMRSSVAADATEAAAVLLPGAALWVMPNVACRGSVYGSKSAKVKLGICHAIKARWGAYWLF